MGSRDPESPLPQLAELRAVYDARSGVPDDRRDRSAARHSKALLERILVVLGGTRDGAGARREPARSPPGP
ncbi:hypothetical protein [Methylobacterium sp. J-070]|uniref:hypothetical protein n=1 Tax=Methylobacterium sp. J-070 TaxID=2836650 RepID=UPI001FB9161C|nr:hypothetical protein [Methylobacterium sp. J-070]MCJ2050415.1 hypothetical protein [Methylobacterium sp. J-070]